MVRYIEDCVHIIRSAYPGISVREILWDHDFHWVHDTIERINTDERERRRWNLAAILAANLPTAFGATHESGRMYQELMDALTTDAEREAQWQSRQDEMRRVLAAQNQATIERWKAIEAREAQAREGEARPQGNEGADTGGSTPPGEQHATFIDPQSGVVIEMSSL